MGHGEGGRETKRGQYKTDGGDWGKNTGEGFVDKKKIKKKKKE